MAEDRPRIPPVVIDRILRFLECGETGSITLHCSEGRIRSWEQRVSQKVVSVEADTRIYRSGAKGTVVQ